MKSVEYIVVKIEGEYAYLLRTDAVEGKEIFISLDLLPASVRVGDRVRYKDLKFLSYR